MTERLIDRIDRIASEAGLEEVTPEIRIFAWLITQDALIGFWEASQHYAKFERDQVDRYLNGTKAFKENT